MKTMDQKEFARENVFGLGVKKDSWFSHIAVEVSGEDNSNEWCEPVTEKEYCELEER